MSRLHLLKLRDRASYEDRRDTSLTGAQAHQLYLRHLEQCLQAVGGRLALDGQLLIALGNSGMV